VSKSAKVVLVPPAAPFAAPSAGHRVSPAVPADRAPRLVGLVEDR
jgi:hypothetical protein